LRSSATSAAARRSSRKGSPRASEYKGKLPLYHFDLYRLNRSTLLDAESYDEYFYDDGVTVIEWADKIRTLLPEKHIEVKLKTAGEEKRRINIKNVK
jgi:tRNA threonylcarbamoyladenosine biosynthesis protein TsaE